jgi:hypothetical protein
MGKRGGNNMNAGFLNNLSSEEIGEIDGKIIYRLFDDLLFRDEYGRITIIQKGFQTDLASVPRVPIVFMLWGDRAHREAVLHDYFYRTNSVPLVSRSEADNYFRLAMISRGQPWRIYYPMYLGVRAGGGSAYHKYPVGHQYIK